MFEEYLEADDDEHDTARDLRRLLEDTVKDDPAITDLPRAQIRQAYWIDDYTLSIPLDCSQIEKNKKYGLVLRGNGYATKDYVYMNNDYTIIYNTTQQ